MLLQQLALAMQNAPKGRAVQVSKGWAADALAPHFREVAESERKQRAQDFLEQEEVDSGIIVSRATEIAFRHLTFQEFLAAKAVAGMPDAAQQDLLLAERTIYKPEWREVALLLGGVLYRQGQEKVDGLISAVLEKMGGRATLLRKAHCAGLLGAMVSDLRPFSYQPADPRYRQTMELVLGIFDADKAYGLEFPVRQDNWVTITGGGPKRVKPFQIARYPVTVEEHRHFVDDEGYQNERWWQAGGFAERTEPDNWDEQVQHPNRPVTGVSWFEASAYCAWDGVRLPTEAEWHQAARGLDGREYPWGNNEPDETRANFGNRVGRATPVGLYPAGATPEGVADMAGNVWEWVEDWYQRRKKRVLRGGSFVNGPQELGTAFRGWGEPAYWFNDIGFRCLRKVVP
jgi:hypothetical protein